MSAERLLISAILKSGSNSEVKILGLAAKDFTAYKEEFAYLMDSGVPSIATFQERFPDFKVRNVKSSDIHLLVDRVRDNKIRRELQIAVKSIADQLGEKKPIDLVMDLSRKMDTIQGSFSTSKDVDLIGNAELMVNEYRRRLRSSKSGQTAGIPFGIPTLDKEIGGMFGGEIITIVGRQGDGKTWLSLEFSTSAIIHNKRVLYISLEMPPELIGFRVHTLLFALLNPSKKQNKFPNLSLIMGKDINSKTYASWLETVRKDHKNSKFIVPSLSRNFIFSTATVAAKIEEHRPDLVVIDYIGLMAGENKRIENWQEIGQQMKDLKNFALRYNLPIIVNAQANRSAADPKSESVPMLHQIAGSDAIGASSDRVISLRLLPSKRLRIGLEKNRYGRDKFHFDCKWDINQGFLHEMKPEDGFEE